MKKTPLKRSSKLGAGLTNEVRKFVYRRDGWECVCCGSTRSIGVHHVIHRSQGGPNEPWNLVTLCELCHRTAHGDRPVWAGAPLDLTPEDVEQTCVEYLADHYIELGALWTPEGLIDLDLPTIEDLSFLMASQYTQEWDSALLAKYLDGRRRGG